LNDDGYTLAEMLVALVLAGLATSALATTARLAARSEERIRVAHTTAVGLSRLSEAAGGALREAGPFETGAAVGAPRFEGDPRQALFDCGDRRCELEIGEAGVAFARGGVRRTHRVPALKAPALRYVSGQDGRVTSQWPPPDRADRLAAVVLMDRAGPVSVLSTVREQPASCVFDLASRRCAARVRP
jgi:prepilin-type N-terminal cleavage/methylation domain-containing protein